MKKHGIPFAFLPEAKNKSISLRMIGLGGQIKNVFPYLELELKQSELDYNAEEYGAMILFYSAIYFVSIFLLVFLTLFFVKINNAALIALTVAMMIGVLIMMQISLYPKVLLKKKIREIDSNLVFALRTMIIQIISGISLYNAMKIVAKQKHGTLSDEFARVVEEMSAGIPQEKALEELATRNPSASLRKAIWQIVNGLKSGSETGQVLRVTADGAIKDKMMAIREYGEKLKLFSLMYVMIGIIFPALGLTFLTVTASFSGLGIKPDLLWALMIGILVIEFMYIGFIKTARPAIMG